MNCEAIQEQLTLQLDGELGGAQEAALEAHLQSCVACREAGKKLLETAGVLAGTFRGVLDQAPPLPRALRELTAHSRMANAQYQREERDQVSSFAIQSNRAAHEKGPASESPGDSPNIGGGAPAQHRWWMTALAAAALLLVWVGRNAYLGGSQSSESDNASVSVVRRAARKCLARETLEAIATRGQRSLHIVLEGERFFWSERASESLTQLAAVSGGSDGENTWLYLPEQGVFQSQVNAGENNWLPAGIPGNWPFPMGPRGLEFLRSLTDQEFEVLDVGGEGDSLSIKILDAEGRECTVVMNVEGASPQLTDLQFKASQVHFPLKAESQSFSQQDFLAGSHSAPDAAVHPSGQLPEPLSMDQFLRELRGETWGGMRGIGYLGYVK